MWYGPEPRDHSGRKKPPTGAIVARPGDEGRVPWGYDSRLRSAVPVCPRHGRKPSECGKYGTL
ncbi:hypothetical protein GCM10010106_45200 [Thermopolyspora flexuosa]|nr:hypothetical protein GCM10010106_45200 [Thermopolyspora flexuosa]